MTALGLMASLRLEDGRRWGDAATAVQLADAEAVLNLSGPRRHWIGRAKGYSKTSDVAGLCLAALLEQAPSGVSAYAAANDADQARLLLQSVSGFVERTPGLIGEVQVDNRRVVARRRGAELVVLPADTAGSHGLRPWLLVVDELGNWADDARHRSFFDTVWAGLPKVADSRGVVITTASDPAHFSRKLYDRAAQGGSWRLSDVRGPAPWMSRAELEDERRRMLPSTYARWFENRWVGGEDRLVSREMLEAAAVLDGPQLRMPGFRYFVGADVGLSHDRTAVAVVHSEPVGDGAGVRRRRVVVDALRVLRGSRERHVDLDQVERLIAGLSSMYGGARVRIDPWQAEHISQHLRSLGVPVEQRSYSSVLFDQMATGLYNLLREGLLALPRDDALIDELASVRLRETTPGRFRIDTDTSRQHDDMAMAIGYALTLMIEAQGWATYVPAAAERWEERALARSNRTLTAGTLTREF